MNNTRSFKTTVFNLALPVALAIGALSGNSNAAAQAAASAHTAAVIDSFESISVASDAAVTPANGSVAIKVLTVPATLNYRLTDLSVDPRNANTDINPCFFEVWRGDENAPKSLAWSRVRIYSNATYDRSWVTGLQFEAGETLWVVARFDPMNTGLGLCSRRNINAAAELRYALRGQVLSTAKAGVSR